MDALVPVVVVASVACGLLGLALAAVAWQYREVPAALPFAGMMLAVGLWAFAEAAFLTSGSLFEAYVAERFARAAGIQVPPLWLLFGLAYAGHEEWLDWKTVGAVWAVPVAVVVLLATAPLHGLAATLSDTVVLTTGGVTAPYVPPGTVYGIAQVYAYVVMTAGFLLVVSFLVRSRAVYRKQTVALLAGIAVPLLGTFVATVGVIPHPSIVLTPISFAVMGVVFGWALVTYDFLTVTPMAEDVLIDELPDPVFVVDEDERVVDYNPAALAAFGHDDPVGERLEAVVPGLTDGSTDDLAGDIFRNGGGSDSRGDGRQSLGDGPERHGDAPDRHGDAREDTDGGPAGVDRLADGGEPTFYEPTVTTLEDQYGTARSKLVVLRDVTGQQRRQERLEVLQDATRQFLAASTDDQIAEIAIDYVEGTLSCEAAGVFLVDDDGALVPAATSDTATDLFRPDELVVEPDDDWTAYEAFESGEPVGLSLDDETGGPIEQLLFLPLGELGILAVGTVDPDGFGASDEGFATILARTTQVALARAERESELRQNRRALERRTEQIAFFNGVLRHSLRNALLVIEGRAEHLREHLPEDQHEHVDTIARWCGDLDELSEEIRSVNDTVTASESERLETVNLSATLRGKTPGYRRRYPEATVDLDVPDGIEILANDLAETAIDAVVDNAVVHNDGDAPHVEIWTRHAADRVQLHVADDGPGMTDEMKSIVFERAVSTNQTASGFGLHFVSVLLNLYGGNLRFEDNDPEGTVAVLEFQLVNDGDG